MSEQHPQENLLIRYIDNLANPAERKQAEQLILSDSSAAALYRDLEKTRAPLQHCIDEALPAANQNFIALIDGNPPRHHRHLLKDISAPAPWPLHSPSVSPPDI